MKFQWKKVLPHVVAILVFAIVTMAYFAPVFFDNKDLAQGDVTSYMGWGDDVRQHYQKTGEISFWSNAMFAGMPANYAYPPKSNNVFQYVAHIAECFMPTNTAGVFFVYLIGFYIFMLCIGCSPWLSIFGALAYALCSYNIIIIDAGHVSKALVMGTIAPIVGGVILCYRGRYALGAIVTILSVGLNVFWNHQQVTFYILIMLACLAICYLVYAIKEHRFKQYIAASAILVASALLAASPAVDKLLPTMDFSKETMRGGAVLKNDAKGEKENAGLNIDYAYMWSYGKAETMTLLIPNFYGASSNYNLGTDSHFYEAVKPTGQASQIVKNSPTYWGDQPFTSGPVYAGAIICFLFVLGLLICKGKERWWLLAATIIAIVLSWGKNLPGLNNWLFYHLPLYNKFRTPSMALVIANFTMAAMAMICLKEIIERKNDLKFNNRMLYIAFGVVGGLCLFFALFGSSLFSFQSSVDAQLPDWALSGLIEDRKAMLTGDAWRSFIFILLAAVVLWLYQNEKIKQQNIIVVVVGLLCFIDLWSVDRRFVNDDSFISARQARTLQASAIDEQIRQDRDPNYRVLNLTTNTFNESRTSYFHKSIGGYSPVKLRRYQDIIDYYLSGQISMPVISMLNTKYVIVNTQQGPMAQLNPEAMGNCWFVDSLQWVNTPDEEIVALGTTNLHTTALVDKEWAKCLPGADKLAGHDSTAFIRMDSLVNPGYITYTTSAAMPRLAVFSEVFYKTWHCYIDGKEAPIARANYILRAVEVPEGQHKIEFRCVDDVYLSSHRISLIASIAVGVVLLALIALLFICRRKETAVADEAPLVSNDTITKQKKR